MNTGHGFASIDAESNNFSTCCEQTGHGFASINAESSDFLLVNRPATGLPQSMLKVVIFLLVNRPYTG